MSKIGLFLANGFEEIEALTVVDILRRANQEIDTISITEDSMVLGAHEISVEADRVLTEIDFTKYDVLVLPGGMPGTIHLGECKKLMEAVSQFVNDGKLVCAICAAPSLLGDLQLLQGKKAVCYPGFEERLVGAKVSMEKVVTDGNLITARGMGCAIPFSLAIVEYLLSEEEAHQIKEAIIYGH